MVAPPSNLSVKDRRALFVLVIVVTSLTALHYYHQIKLTRMKIKELEEENGS